MEFKIDTKVSYTVIKPVENRLDANLAAVLSQKWAELTANGSCNLIVDLSDCTEGDTGAIPGLLQLHEESYSHECSLVFTGLEKRVSEMLKNNEEAELLNITPTLVEAIDIVSMEILERDLFKEEE
jgi:anti-anti-sigma regulatory factor